MGRADTPPQRDVIATEDSGLSAQIEKVIATRNAVVPPEERPKRYRRGIEDPSLALRRGLIEGRESDPNGFERILGQSDLLSINFLDRGRRSAEAVCRIKLPMEGGAAYGTGFLVGPRLLLTNHHVLANEGEAAQAEAEFGYEHDIDGVLRAPVGFNLDPHQLFFTSAEADFTLVGVSPVAADGTPLDRFGWLPLIPLRAKSVDGERVTIIRHPGGAPKQIAIHASQIIKLDPKNVGANLDYFIHYSTDTEPGSSGSPVLNDQWQVVAVHHKAVPAPQRRGEPVEWIANEGVRVSAIFILERNRFESGDARRALDLLSRGLGFPPVPARPATPSSDAAVTEQSAPFKADHWADAGLGYDPGFLQDSRLPGGLPLDEIYAPLLPEIAPLRAGGTHELRYFHFSSVMHAERKFPVLTAVNIDGGRLVHPGKRTNAWRQDARMDPGFQPDDDFYVRTRAEEKVYFSRGHLVRLLDPCWSDSPNKARQLADAKRGMDDSFHFTNAAPQVQAYNDQDWGDLEDYVLDRAQSSERRISVFTGPIFHKNDPVYGRNRKGGPWQIPLSFWKIAVLQTTGDEIAAAAFIIGQTEYVRALYEAKVFSGLKPYTIDELRSRKNQTAVATVEEETGLDFSRLRPFDRQGSLESTRRTRWFNRPDDIQI